MQDLNMARQWAVRILCAMALLLVGFGHQPMAVAQMSAAERGAYTLPDGTLPDLCIDNAVNGAADGQPSGHIHKQVCDACRISASILVPQPTWSGGVAVDVGVLSPRIPRDDIVVRRVLSPGCAPRGPPELAIRL